MPLPRHADRKIIVKFSSSCREIWHQRLAVGSWHFCSVRSTPCPCRQPSSDHGPLVPASGLHGDAALPAKRPGKQPPAVRRASLWFGSLRECWPKGMVVNQRLCRSGSDGAEEINGRRRHWLRIASSALPQTCHICWRSPTQMLACDVPHDVGHHVGVIMMGVETPTGQLLPAHEPSRSKHPVMRATSVAPAQRSTGQHRDQATSRRVDPTWNRQGLTPALAIALRRSLAVTPELESSQ